MTIKNFKKKFLLELSDLYPAQEVHSFFYLLTEAYLNKSRLELALAHDFKLKDSVEADFTAALQDLKEERPIQYIIGKTEFMDLTFEVNEQVLIPRPETEELVNWILETSDPSHSLSVLDIGTGSGCIAVVLAKILPGYSIEGLEVSGTALEVARRNAALNQVEVTFTQGDVLSLKQLDYTYDLIVSNPPYVRENEKKEMQNNVLKFEPDLALYVPDRDPLRYYRHISGISKKALRSGGSLFFEINQSFGQEMIEMLNEMGFENIQLRKDLYGADRMIRADKK